MHQIIREYQHATLTHTTAETNTTQDESRQAKQGRRAEENTATTTTATRHTLHPIGILCAPPPATELHGLQVVIIPHLMNIERPA